MARYVYTDELSDVLASFNLAALSTDSAIVNEYLDEDIAIGESTVDALCGREFTPLAQHVHVVSGRGSTVLRLPNTPVFDVQSVQVGVDGVGIGYAINGSDVRVNRRSGSISVRDNMSVTGATPLAAMSYFPRGDNNIVVSYRTSYAQVGDNIGTTALAAAAIHDVAAVTTDASYAYIALARPMSGWKKDGSRTLDSIAPTKMLKAPAGGTAVDDSSHWTMLTPSRLRCAIANYSATAQYTLCYVPHAIGQAALLLAACETMRKRSIRDAAGSGGGSTLRVAGPFQESYGQGYQYKGQIDAFTERAMSLIKPYICAVVA